MKKSNKMLYNILIYVFIMVIVISLIWIGLRLMETGSGKNRYVDIAEEITVSTGIKAIPEDPRELIDNPDLWFPEDDVDDVVEEVANFFNPDATPRPTRDPNAPTRDPNAPKKTPKPDPKDYSQYYEIPTLGVNFNKLRDINPDVCGWLYLPDSVINYPVVQISSARNTDYYLSHTYDHKENISGTLFIDAIGSNAPFSGRNTFIHGHRMNNGAMFGALNKYSKQSYYDTHKTIQLYTPSRNYLIHVFAAFTADLGGYESTMYFNNETEYLAYLNNSVKKSDIKTNYTPRASDKIITMSTCVVNKDTKRFMVQGWLSPMP